MNQKEIQELVFAVTIIVLILAIALIIFFAYFQKKKTDYLIKQRETQKRFEEEIKNSKLEIQEQALQNISWEIHDNVGQLLSVARMQLNMLQVELEETAQPKIRETSDIIGKSLQELRGLAKSLNPESIKNNGLIESIRFDINRFNRLNFIDGELKISDVTFQLDDDKEVILFRILQEFCNNTLKYAVASTIKIELNYTENDILEIYAEDNGKGFDLNDSSKKNGIGILNMKSRAALINAKIKLSSALGKGTKLYIRCPK